MNKLLSFLFRRSQCEYAVEFCPRCDANLTLQRGYRNDLPYWECKGCGEMLINPNIDTETNIVWLCDECGAMLNVQTVVLCQDLVQVKMSFSHSNLPAIPKLPVDTIFQNHRVTYNRNDYEFAWYYKTFPSIQIPSGMHVCNC